MYRQLWPDNTDNKEHPQMGRTLALWGFRTNFFYDPYAICNIGDQGKVEVQVWLY